VSQLELIDVGAGKSPYKNFILSKNISYYSQDFGGYLPDGSHMGLHETSWSYPNHNYVCDILDIPQDKKFDVVLCTEVLEHVPDPVRAFEIMTALLKPKGTIIITVPLMSLTHYAPFWFQSGLSQYWFEYWAPRVNIENFEILLHGDFIDMEVQNMKTFFDFKKPWRVPGLSKIVSAVLKVFRPFLKSDVKESGGFGVFFIGEKEDNV
jgi:SAM-dependent methyltransferase